MSHNTDPQKAARRHPAPIVAIVIVLVVVVLAAFVFLDTDPAAEGDVSRSDTIQQADPAPGAPAQPAPSQN